MTGSDRLPSTETLLRAPYAAPRDSASRDVASRDVALRATVRAEGRAVAAMLAPFVPREFRDVINHDVLLREQTHRDVTVVPVVERVKVVSPEVPLLPFLNSAAESPASADVLLENNFSAIVDDEVAVSHFEDADAETELSADLPWIDAFAVEASEAEETWPMGEAGKRLDELTQSLTSLDASRARQQAESESAPLAADGEHEMWNEEEWIDIMPTPLPASSSAELHHLISEAEAHVEPLHDVPGVSTPIGAESAARALEGLAQRVRAGQVQVPSFTAEVAEEAMLAGLLASMLGWRQ